MAQAKYYVLLLLVCLIWGATPACGKLTVEAFSPMMITGMRFGLMSLALFTWLLLSKDYKAFRPVREVWWVIAAMGFMGVLVHNGLLFIGLNYTTATNTALIESIGPTVTTLLAFFFLGERLNAFGWVGIFISCIGAVCIVAKGSLDVLINMSFNIGDVMILFCEIAWSCYVIISWHAHNKISTIALTAWSSLCGSVMCFTAGLLTGTLEVYEVSSGALWGFAYLVVFSGIFAFVAWNYGTQHVGASKAGVFIYLVPLTGGIIGVVILGEEVLFAQIAGAMLIMGGVMITVRAKVRLKEDRESELAEKQGRDVSEEDLLRKFPELAAAHDAKLAEIERRSAERDSLSFTSPVNTDRTPEDLLADMEIKALPAPAEYSDLKSESGKGGKL